MYFIRIAILASRAILTNTEYNTHPLILHGNGLQKGTVEKFANALEDMASSG
jgi:hypothetical protein